MTCLHLDAGGSLAFQVSNKWSEECRVVFATTAAKARYAAVGAIGDDYPDMRAKRRPEWDQYVTAGVPAAVLRHDGWWMSEIDVRRCDSCGCAEWDEIDASEVCEICGQCDECGCACEAVS